MTTERIADHVKFAYWVPNVSGGLVTSDIEQRTDWNYEYNAKLAQTAENNGFEYALSQVRYEASYGAEYQHESTSFSLALLLATQKLKVIAAIHPGLWQPADFRGDFYRIHDYTLKPKPLNRGGPTRRYSRAATPRRPDATAAATPTGTSPTARISTGSPNRSSRCATMRAMPVARSASASTAHGYCHWCGKSKIPNRIRSIRRCWCPLEVQVAAAITEGALALMTESLRPAQERS